MGSATITSRQALIDCATSLFLEQGFDAVSMEQVRLKANVSNGSLYHHFPTKAHLGRSVYLAALTDYQQHMLVSIDEATSARDGVRKLVARHIAWVLRSPRLALVLDRLRPFTAIEGSEPDWEAANAQALTHLQSWIARREAQGDMRKLPFAVWLALVLGPSMQLTPGWALQRDAVVAPRVRRALADAAWWAVRTMDPAKARV